MLNLDATTDQIRMTLGDAGGTVVQCAAFWADTTTTTFVRGKTRINSNGTTAIALVGSPGASTQRAVEMLSAFNTDTAAHVVTISFSDNGTLARLWSGALQPGESVVYAHGDGWWVFDSNGKKVTAANASPSFAQSYAFEKIGTAAEAAGQWYMWAKDTGSPGAWTVGTPGMTGRVCTSEAGGIPVPDPASGDNYLVGFDGSASAVGGVCLLDLLWVQSGIGITTLTAQTINSVAFPARDISGTVNGVGVQVGIYVSATTGAAGAMTNITMGYTNSAGGNSRTATMASFPASAVLGTIVWFQLQAGDTGVQSIQTVTSPTSHVSGTIHMIAARVLATRGDLIANIPTYAQPVRPESGVRIYDGSTLLLAGMRAATTATNIIGNIYVATR